MSLQGIAERLKSRMLLAASGQAPDTRPALIFAEVRGQLLQTSGTRSASCLVGIFSIVFVPRCCTAVHDSQLEGHLHVIMSAFQDSFDSCHNGVASAPLTQV